MLATGFHNRLATPPIASSPPCTPKNGEDAGEMQSFVQQHLVSFLKPISEHVREVQAEVRRISQDLLRKSALIDRNRERVDAIEMQFGDVAATAKEVDRKMARMYQDTTKPVELMMKAFREQLDGEMQKLSGTVHSSVEKISALQSAEADIRKNLFAVEVVSEEAATKSRALALTITDLDSKFAELKHCHWGMSARLEDTKHKTQDNTEALTKLVATVTHQGEEAKVGMARLNKKIQGLDSKMDRYQAENQALADRVQATKDDIIHLFKQLGDVEYSLTEATSVPKEDPSKDLVDKVEREVEQLGLSLRDWRTALKDVMQRCEANDDGLKGLQSRLDEDVAQQLAALSSAADKHGQRLDHTEANVQTLQGESQAHAARIAATEGRLAHGEECQKALQGALTAVGKTVEGLSNAQADAMTVLEEHGNRLDKLQDHLVQHDKSLHNMDTGMKDMHSWLEVVDLAVARESGRLDLAHEYIQGVGKGLQDAQNRADGGEDGLLPRKPGTPSPILPGIPQARRPASARSLA